MSMAAGKREAIGANERVVFSDAKHVEREGQRVENDHSYLMSIGDTEVWLRKDNMHLSGDGKCSITASHARDMNMPVEGDVEAAAQDPLSQASLGANSAAPAATKDPGSQPKQSGQSKQQS